MRLSRGLILIPGLVVGVLLVGCREEAGPPTAPEAEPALATTAVTTLLYRQVSAGTYQSCGVTTVATGNGAAYCWGLNGFGEIGDGTHTRRLKPVKVAGGHRFLEVHTSGHTCGLTTSNLAYCWGFNRGGKLGDGTTEDRLTPVAVLGGLKFRQLSVGGTHTCGLATANRVFCWELTTSASWVTVVPPSVTPRCWSPAGFASSRSAQVRSPPAA